MNTRILEDLGGIVRFHRKRSGLTQAELARLAGVGKTVVFQLEKGKTTVRLDTASRILAALNIGLNVESPLMDEMDTAANDAERGDE